MNEKQNRKYSNIQGVWSFDIFMSTLYIKLEFTVFSLYFSQISYCVQNFIEILYVVRKI